MESEPDEAGNGPETGGNGSDSPPPVHAEADPDAILASLSAVDDYLPPTVLADVYEKGEPPALYARGAEGITTFQGYSREKGHAHVWSWIDRQVQLFFGPGTPVETPNLPEPDSASDASGGSEAPSDSNGASS